jgi:hypothetical protein
VIDDNENIYLQKNQYFNFDSKPKCKMGGGLYSPHFCRGDPWGISEQNVKCEISGSHGGQYEF